MKIKILNPFRCCFQLPKDVEVLDCISESDEISAHEIGVVVNIEEDRFETIVRHKQVKEIDFESTSSDHLNLPEIHPVAGGDFDYKLTMVSVLDENYKPDFVSDSEAASDEEIDTLDLINQTSASMNPILSDTFHIERDFRDSLTVLDAPDLQVHDSRLSFDPIPIGCMRKLVAESQNKLTKLAPANEESEEDIEELKDLQGEEDIKLRFFAEDIQRDIQEEDIEELNDMQDEDSDDENYDETKFSSASSSSSVDNLEVSLDVSEIIGLHTDEMELLNKRIEQLQTEYEELLNTIDSNSD